MLHCNVRRDWILCGVSLAAVALAGAAQAQVRVAVVFGGQATGPECAAQLNDDTHVDFDAVAVGASSVDTLTELQQYHCVILGDAGYRDNGYTEQMFAAMREYLDWGGGIVTTGWYNYATDIYGGQMAADADYITPILDSSYEFRTSGGTVDTTDGHPITNGIGDFLFTANHHEYETAVDANATSLGTIADRPGSVAIAYQETNGRSVYLGGLYLAASGYNNSGLRSGIQDQLLEQAVSWAGGGPTGCLQMTVSDLVAGQQGIWSIEEANANTHGVIVWGLNAGETVVNGNFGYCSTFNIQNVGPNRIVGFWTADGNGDATVMRMIPSNVSGLTVLTQASERDTCPRECMSEVDEQTIG